MTLKQLAHTAHHQLQSACGISMPRSHVHELLAAAFGYGSWAAFRADCVLCDAGIGDMTPENGPTLAGRALQLSVPQRACHVAASSLHALLQERRIGAMRWHDVEALTRPAASQGSKDEGWAEDDEDDLDFDDEAAPEASPSAATHLAGSALLLDELASRELSPQVHHQLARAFRCRKPNPYLYEESLKGRVLTKHEQAWVNQYLIEAPQYRAFEHHLRQAALGGVRQAAAEFAAEFDDATFYERAKRLDGEVDARTMAELAPTVEQRHDWLRAAADQGSHQALDDLAHAGDNWALERLAREGDVEALRTLAEEAVDSGDRLRAWAYQNFAATLGVDLTQSDYRAYHSEGEHAGEFYDSDFGGPMHVDGSPAVELPVLDGDGHSRAREMALRFAGGASLANALEAD
ncbi:hypothetical protein [Methylibium petroleiphilum]|uniref:Uncharacterized protein n=1 Tax=Methylibium petroleiphilum (strain ATCC BAA-1232 / LMG 22953 / PM1) TaxID=420662 RepID=A2SNX6_METPP|nr:hypothetical protein [Methylibium petroleiphilum]ABM97265.1 hypothetical protein Mpe_B0493 [Methylibium petroleiphilum PM1]